MGYAKQAAKSTVMVFSVSILAGFFGYLIRMVLARNLSPAEYGLFFACLTFITFIALFKRLGLHSALLKFIPDLQVKKKYGQIKEAIVAVMGINILLSVVIGALIVLFSQFLATHYFKEQAAVQILYLFAIVFVVMTFKFYLRIIFNAFQRMFTFSIMYLVENSLILIIILVLFYFQKSISNAVYAHIITFIVVFLVFLPFFFKTFPFFKYKTRFSSELTKKLLRFGIPVALTGIGSIIILYTDTLILTYFRPLAEVGIYNVVVPTAMLLNFFASSVNQVIFPMVSELWAKKLKNHLVIGAELLQKYSFFVVVPAALVMFSFPTILIKVFFGQAYVSGALTLQLLVIGLVFFIVAGINMTILSAINKPVVTTKIMLTGGLFNLITNFYFIPKYGMIGAGITSLASYLLIMMMSAFYLTKFISINVPVMKWIKTFGAGLLFVLVIAGLRKVLEINMFLEAGVCVAAGGIVYLGACYLLKVVDVKEIKDVFLRDLFKR